MTRTLFLLHLIALPTFIFSQMPDDMPHGETFDVECDNCHSLIDWSILKENKQFDHSSTGFPLVASHNFVDCRGCHKTLVFSHVGSACIDCHTDIHLSEFGNECETCHTAQSWENRLDILQIHDETGFPLIGIHSAIDCQSCHLSNNPNDYKLAPVDCKGCHLENFMQTLNPAHQKAGFDLNCESCHLPNASNWEQAIFEHTETFVLSGGHSSLECLDCHSSTYQHTTVDCNSCHNEDYINTQDPSHSLFGFPTLCESCHTTANWTATDFDHYEISGFQLNGAHATSVQCVGCHVDNQLIGIPTDCYDCHASDFNETTDPDHKVALFSHECMDCHTEISWEPSTFDHANTTFELTGAHISLNCVDCHSNGYQNTPTECIACHEDDYNATIDPNHADAQFPTDCESCHNTYGWDPSDFDHDGLYFPIYTLAHREEWTLCSDCHTNPTDYSIYNCLNCHDQATTDEHHKEEADYVYDSIECYNCHPTGQGDDD